MTSIVGTLCSHVLIAWRLYWSVWEISFPCRLDRIAVAILMQEPLIPLFGFYGSPFECVPKNLLGLSKLGSLIRSHMRNGTPAKGRTID